MQHWPAPTGRSSVRRPMGPGNSTHTRAAPQARTCPNVRFVMSQAVVGHCIQTYISERATPWAAKGTAVRVASRYASDRKEKVSPPRRYWLSGRRWPRLLSQLAGQVLGVRVDLVGELERPGDPELLVGGGLEPVDALGIDQQRVMLLLDRLAADPIADHG
jgi:hypothetical protein